MVNHSSEEKIHMLFEVDAYIVFEIVNMYQLSVFEKNYIESYRS